MYLPEHFVETEIEVLHQLIRARPLCTLVTLSSNGIDANHFPLYLSPEPAPFGTLRGHVSRANPIPDGSEALAIFHGPQSYVTPSWYPAKAETGKVVPTWNYVVVHAHGKLGLVEDRAWLRAHLQSLTDRNEAGFPEPWKLEDAPSDFTEKLIGGIVGIELPISRLIGKWKTSQNQPEGNRAGVACGLRECGTPDAMEMADLVEKACRKNRN